MEKVTIIEELIGRIFSSVMKTNDSVLEFYTPKAVSANGLRGYMFYHEQDCCEDVYIDDIVGDLDDLIGTPITMAEEFTEDGGCFGDYDDHITYTFYKFATIKGSVTVKWYGSSNGYYSESVDFREIK